jgi:hypothetical protein
MAPRIPGSIHLRCSSGDSDTDKSLAPYANGHADKANGGKGGNGSASASSSSSDTVVRLLARIFAVDDALVYSCVRRAIEDRYPRSRHHAGLAPLISDIANATPGAGVVRFLGRWVLGRLFGPRRS